MCVPPIVAAEWHLEIRKLELAQADDHSNLLVEAYAELACSPSFEQ